MNKSPSATLNFIAAKHGLEFREKMGKHDVVKATIREELRKGMRPDEGLGYLEANNNRTVVVKYGSAINTHEIGLMKAAAELNLSFQVPQLHYISRPGEPSYYITDLIEQAPLSEVTKVNKRTEGMFFGGNEEAVGILLATANDYQSVLKAYIPTTTISAVVAARGMARFLAAVAVWEAKMMRTTPASARAITQIVLDLSNNYRKYGKEYIGFAHGDIHAKHILTPDLKVLPENKRKEVKPYLLDLNAQVKPGRGFYDKVRGLDSIVAHSHTPAQLGESLSVAVRRLKEEFDPTLLMPVLRARMLAIGTDIQKDPPEDIYKREARNRIRKALIEATY